MLAAAAARRPLGRRAVLPVLLLLLLLQGVARYGQAWLYSKATGRRAVHAASPAALTQPGPTAARAGPAVHHGRHDGRASSPVILQQQASQTTGSVRLDRGFSPGLVIDTSASGGPDSGTTEDEFGQTGDDRKLRSAIESIARDQENLRMSTPLASPKMLIAGTTAVVLAVVASATATLPFFAAFLPAVTSGLFVQTSAGESSGTRSRGLARHNSGQAVALACEQEKILATAEQRKAFLPFGVGLTAIFAAACVSLKLFNEKIGDFIPEDSLNPPLLAADNILIIGFAASAVIGCAFTVEEYLRMRAAMTLKPEDKKNSEEETDWEVMRLPKEARDLEEDERSFAFLFTCLACLSPLIFVLQGFNFEELFKATSPSGFNKEFQELVDSASVVVSATAGALAALVFLLAELQFTDAERRVALQAKQAALSELFFAQSQAEAAAMPAKSAWTGALLAGSAFAVEFTAWVAAIIPWPAVLSTMRQFFSAKLTRSSSDATWLERRIQRTGRRSPRKQDALSSTSRELQRLYSEVFRKDDFTERVKESLLTLPVGAQRDFNLLNSESRRKVHFVAAELGMVSQSDGVKRKVTVTNFGATPKITEGDFQQEIFQGVSNSMGNFGQTVARVANRGVPRDQVLGPAAVATTAAVAVPFVVGEATADLLVPLLTGGIGLATVWQEKEAKAVVASAKQQTAGVRMRVSKAESLFGRAMLAMSALPTYLAVATCACTVSIICFEHPLNVAMKWMNIPLLAITVWVTALAAQRQKGIQFYIKQAVQTVEGRVPPQCWVSGRRWWTVPTAIAVAIPMDLPRRLTIAMAILATEIGIMMSSSFTQLASAEFYAARAQRVWARSDAWAQEASTESRALPLNSAVAVINTLLATALIAFDTPLGALFPVVGFAVCYQALQSRSAASNDSAKSQLEAAEIQVIGTEPPPFLERAAATENLTQQDVNPSTSAVKYVAYRSSIMDDVLPNLEQKLIAEGRSVDQLFEALSLGREEVTWPTFREFFLKFETSLTEGQVERLWLVFDKNLSGGISRSELGSILGKNKTLRRDTPGLRRTLGLGMRRVMKLFDEKKADDYYSASAAERAVDGVQASLSELRLSVRSSERDWLRTGAVVGVSATAALLAPFVLSEVLTEVILPIVGAGLTIFAVAAESDSRRSIAASKVWAAELNEIASTQEELLAVGGLYKARFIALTALSVTIAITCIVIEHPFSFLVVYPQLGFLQTTLQVVLVTVQAILASWVVGRLLTVIEWTKRVRQKVTVTLGANRFDEETPRTWFRGKRRGVGGFKRLLTFGAMVPIIGLAVFPLGRHFAKKAVAATAGGALIVAFVLYVAEYVTSRAEIAQAARMRTFALCDAFTNSAEQQGAVLPLVSAASIALAGLITFLTELNPYFAASLTVLQAVAWIVASRKAVAAKFESEAALKVNLNTMSPRVDASQDPVRRIKRMVLN